MFMKILIFMLTYIIMMIPILITKKTYMDTEKMTPYECGFNPMMFSRTPFSLHFYLIAIIFLIFDVEIMLIMPFMILIFNMNYFFIMNMIMFIIILIFGTYYEWFKGNLNWIY